jgi:chromosome partitioning protein
MGEIVAVANQKGGVGKTTTVENLAVVMGEWGRRVLAVDADPQFALTRHLARERYREFPLTIVEVLAPADEGRVPAAEVVARDVQRGVDLLPSHRNLRRREIGLAGETRREEILLSALEPIRDDYDVVLVDCPPNLGLLTVNALVAADRVLCPVSAEDEGAAQGVAELRATLHALARPGEDPVPLAALITKANRRRRAARGIVDALEAAGVELLATRIPSSAIAHQAPMLGGPVAAVQPDGKFAYAYRQLADEAGGVLA